MNVLRTDRVYEKSKHRLYLNDVGFQGLLCLMQGQASSLQMTHLLMDIIVSRGIVHLTSKITCTLVIMLYFLFLDHPNSYSGALALAYSLAEESLEIKLEFSKRLLAFILTRPNAPYSFVKQVRTSRANIKFS